MAADVTPTTLNFTASVQGVFALGGGLLDYDGDEAGYSLNLYNTSFNSSDFVVRLLDDDAVLAESAVFDITASGGSAGTYTLSLVGSVLASGDLDLVGSLTPDPLSNPNAIAPIVLSSTVAAGDIESRSSLYGVRQSTYGNNTAQISYDNVAVNVVPVPEPTAVAGVMGLAGLMLKRRR